MQAVSRKREQYASEISPSAAEGSTIESLATGQEDEVLAFLAKRPVHTVMLAGLVRDNGLVHPLNRGCFYGCRDGQGRLEGVILVGEIVLLEARCESALATFAKLAQGYANAFMIIGEQEKIARFWRYYDGAGQAPRLYCRELMFELRWPVEVREPVPDLRLATADDLDLIVPVHAEMALEESGVDPLHVDPDGFRDRYLHRIKLGRVWVWTRNRRLIFKADVISDTPDVTYLEGVYITPGERGKGYGSRCLSQLSRDLLSRTRSICLLVNEQNKAAQDLYLTSRFKLQGFYDTIFLQQPAD